MKKCLIQEETCTLERMISHGKNGCISITECSASGGYGQIFARKCQHTWVRNVYGVNIREVGEDIPGFHEELTALQENQVHK